MSIYWYTLKKYLLAKSTWIIIILGLIISSVLGAVLPWNMYDPALDKDGLGYSKLIINLIAGISLMMSIFMSVFSSYKSATMYKDEVEDGTFLVLLSKPQVRTKIILMKWLALQTITIFFIVLTMGSFATLNYILDDSPKALTEGISRFSSQIWWIFLSMSLILLLVSFIMSSIGLLISTKTSTAATIGIGTGLGVIIPITGLLSQFTIGQEYVTSSSGDFEKFELTYSKFVSPVIEEEGLTPSIDALSEIINDPTNGLTTIGIDNLETNPYKIWKYIDLNTQLRQLSSLASDTVVSGVAKDMTNTTTGVSYLSKVKDGAFEDKEKDERVKTLETIIASYLLETNKFAPKAFEESNKYVEVVRTDENNRQFHKYTDNPSFINDIVLSPDTNHLGDIPGKLVHISGSYYDFDMFRSSLRGMLGMINVISNNPNDPSDPDSDRPHMRLHALFNGGKNILNTLAKDLYAVDNLPESYTKEITLSDGRVETLEEEDLRTYYYLEKLAEQGKLFHVERVPYINKWTLVWVYLGIGIALIPLSIIIVKKQDFR